VGVIGAGFTLPFIPSPPPTVGALSQGREILDTSQLCCGVVHYIRYHFRQLSGKMKEKETEMTQDQKPSEGAGRESPGKGKTDGSAEAMSEDTCRCKAVSKKTVPEMLKLMLSDLAFWRKSGKKR